MGYSAISLFTNPAFQPFDFRFSFQNYNNDSMINRFNAADVTFSTGSKRVKEVQLLYKESGSNAIYVIKRFNKSDLGGLMTASTLTGLLIVRYILCCLMMSC